MKNPSVALRFVKENEEQGLVNKPPQNRYIPLSRFAMGQLIMLGNPEYAGMKSAQKEISKHSSKETNLIHPIVQQRTLLMDDGKIETVSAKMQENGSVDIVYNLKQGDRELDTRKISLTPEDFLKLRLYVEVLHT